MLRVASRANQLYSHGDPLVLDIERAVKVEAALSWFGHLSFAGCGCSMMGVWSRAKTFVEDRAVF